MYHEDTGLYYLQSRYYDPQLGRFINADGLTSTGQGFIGNNMLAYCGNNPIVRNDPFGTEHRPVGAGIQLDVDYGCYTGGIEIILYWDSEVCGDGGWRIAIYSYEGASFNMNDPFLGSAIAAIRGCITSRAGIMIPK